MSDQLPIWINGEVSDRLPADDRGLAYGDGVFETIRVAPRPVLEQFHFDRLAKGLAALGLVIDQTMLYRFYSDYLNQHQPELIKLIITRGSGGRGYLPPEKPAPNIIVQGFALPEYPAEWQRQGIDLFLCDTPLSVNPSLAGIKHLNRLEQVLARREFATAPCQEGLMANAEGKWLEGTMSNLFLVNAGTLYSPPLEQCAVNGTMQRFILNCCRDMGAPLVTCDITSQQLQNMDIIFVCNSVFGLWRVKSLVGKTLSPTGSDDSQKRSVALLNAIQQKVSSLLL